MASMVYNYAKEPVWLIGTWGPDAVIYLKQNLNGDWLKWQTPKTQIANNNTYV